MDGEDFISLGDGQSGAAKRPKVIGQTKEERQKIARSIRLANKKVKKKEKSDAKKQRKQNAIMQRRMTRNNEKYSKNKDRNKQRAIDLERQRIRNEAIRQAEALAAKHDPSGKLFNVGEVVTLPDGTVKSKAALQRMEESKALRESDRREKEAAKKAKEETKKALKEGKLPPSDSSAPVVEGVNPARAALIRNLEDITALEKNPKISNKQKQRLELFKPKPVPPKPVIPEGYSIPEGEEDFLALWDITEEEIQQRLIKENQRKGNARRELRRQQKAQQKINKQVKIRRKHAANLGILFDKAAALKEIMGQQSDSDSEDSEGEDSDGSLEFDSDGGVAEKPKKPTKGDKKQKVWEKRPKVPKKQPTAEIEEPVSAPEPIAEIPETKPEEKKSKKSKRSAPEDADDEPKPKKSKKSRTSTSEIEPDAVPTPETEVDESAGKEEVKRLKKEAKRAAKELAKANEALLKNNLAIHAAETEENPSKKRKRSNDQAGDIEPTGTENSTSVKKDKKKKKDKTAKREDIGTEEPVANGSNVAEQWNPEGLTGDEARKAKYLRLLGAGKANGAPAVAASAKGQGSAKTDIEKVESELERQYEAGIKLKHDSGGKRRGLGA